MAEESVDSEALLSRARALEDAYDWSGAAATYSQLLDKLPSGDLLGTGNIEEAVAYALYRAAFQSDNITDFRTALEKASDGYQKALVKFGESDDSRASPYLARCRAMMEFIRFWRSEKGGDKKKAVLEAWRLAKESMTAFESHGNHSELISTWDGMWKAAIFCSWFADHAEKAREAKLEVVDFGERAVQHLQEDELKGCLAMTHAVIGLLLADLPRYFEFGNQKMECSQRACNHWKKAVDLSPLDASIGLANIYFGSAQNVPFDLNRNEFLALFENAMAAVRTTRDKFRIGCGLMGLAYQNEWLLESIEDGDELRDQVDKVLRYAKEAKESLAVLSPPSPLLSGWYIDTEAELALDMTRFESDPARKRNLAKKSLDSLTYLTTSEEAELPLDIMFAKIFRAFALVEFVRTETAVNIKRRTLEEAIKLGRDSVSATERLWPFHYYPRGAWLGCVAEAECELASLIEDPAEKLKIFMHGIQDKRESVRFIEKSAISERDDPGVLASLGMMQRELGNWLVVLSRLSDNRTDLVDASVAFEQCAQSYGKADMPSRVAESCWMTAQVYELQGDYLKASEKFNSASQSYLTAIDKIPRLKSLYEDYSKYMQAWSEVEKARHYHMKQDFSTSRTCWESAARLHKSIDRWKYLSTNYLAWAEIENAEELSQKEKSKESSDAFRKATSLFEDSRIKMQEQLAKIDVDDEKQMAQRLIAAAGKRLELCEARIALEEARLLDRAGNSSSASEKYGLAADMFTKIKQGLPTDQDIREIELIVTLTKAWEAMAKAEGKSSPELYEEAARLFDEAKSLSLGDRAANLAMGHNRFCKALQAGVKFSDTGDLAQHEIATANLESAGKYYLKAGLESASEYARASKLLFDAYVHMSKAGKEEDHEKKTRLYALAEKILQASASSYDKADQPGKKEQVLKILAKVQQDKELAVSLAEVLRAPDAVTNTMAFSSPTPTHETAVGLDRFEHADIQATLIVKPKELLVDQALTLEIELVNAGRGVAQLTKVDKVIPEGFEVAAEPEKYRIEDSYLNMKGRRLDALKTEDVKLSLKPKSKGQFTVKPRIMYLDESGKYKSFELEPVVVTVKELGFSGWLKGSDKKK